MATNILFPDNPGSNHPSGYSSPYMNRNSNQGPGLQAYGESQQQQQRPMGADDLQFQSFSYDNSGTVDGQAYQPPTYEASYNPTVDMSEGVTWQSIRDAFSTGNLPGEPPLLEELGVNFEHIKTKSMTVLNPVARIDSHIMDDTDLAGPLIFCFMFGGFLLLSGKAHFGYIYGVATLGCLSMYTILNLMSESGIDIYRTASVLGYALLPMVVLSSLSILLQLTGWIGLILSSVSVLWCTSSASLMFVTVLSMNEQRGLVAYPVALLYSAFALLAVF